MKKLAVLLTILALILATVPVSADSVTGFQYHGYLEDLNGPVTDTCSFEFKLYDALTAGTQVGSTLASDTVTVTDGWFWINLDFGSVYDGSSLYLETAVTCDANPLQTLSPRQELGATPYALYSKASPWAGLTGMPAGFADGVDDTANYTAGNGLAIQGTEIAVDFAVAQVRITGSCPSGQYMQSVNADGSVNCGVDADTDTNTTYTNGTGLQLTGTTFSVDYSTTQARISTACQSGYVMTGVNASGVPTCTVDVGGTSYTATDGVTLNGTTFSADTTYMQRRVSNTCTAGSYVTGVNASGVATCTAAVAVAHDINGAQHTGTPLGVTKGGTGTTTQMTAGSVLFAGTSGVYSQDNANLFWDDVNNRLGIGTTVPASGFIIDAVGGSIRIMGNSGYLGFDGRVFSSSTHPAFMLSRGRGTMASPSGVQSNDTLGAFSFNGYTSSGANKPVADIIARAKQNFTTTALGTSIEFYVTKLNTASEFLAMSVLDTGVAWFEKGAISKDTVQATGFTIGNSSGTLTATGVTTSLTVLYDAQVNSDNYVRYCSYVTLTITGGIITAVSSPTAYTTCPAYVP